MSNTIWQHDSTNGEFVDFIKPLGDSDFHQLLVFRDIYPVFTAMTFNLKEKTCYMRVYQSTATDEVNLIGDVINITWDEGFRILGNQSFKKLVKDAYDRYRGLKLDPNDPVAKCIEGTMFVVEANSYERMCLWKERKNATWEDDRGGYFITIGHVDDRPICVSLSWAKINGQKVMFVEMTSELADFKKLDDWILANFDVKWDKGTRVARCDAMNFGTCLCAIEEKNSEQAATV